MKNTQKRYIGALILGGLLAATQTSYGGNITIKDQNGGLSTPYGGFFAGGNEYGFNGGPTGVGSEDNEVEAGYNPAIVVPGFGPLHEVGSASSPGTEQKWDLEAFSLNGSQLSLISGFNINTGEQGASKLIAPGHLFIKVGGGAPSIETSDPLSSANTYGYTYAIDILGGKIYDVSGATPGVVKLDPTINSFFGANPWKVEEAPELNTGFSVTRNEFGLTPADVFARTGDASLLGLTSDVSDIDNDHRGIITLDLSNLFATFGADQDIWFHFTEECGNDTLEGKFHTTSVPDGGASAMLLGFGLLGLTYFGRRVQKA